MSDYTADDITDGMVERAFNSAASYEAVVINKTIMREALVAALTPPEARPEGAEELHPVVDEFLTLYWRGDIDGPDAADWLASRGVRLNGDTEL